MFINQLTAAGIIADVSARQGEAVSGSAIDVCISGVPVQGNTQYIGRDFDKTGLNK
jgi:hypothetical protein